MLTEHRHRVAIAALVLVGCQKSAEKTGSPAAAAVAKSGFTKLFNGKDLTGWETDGRAKWVVENGMLVGTQGENNAPGDLFTDGRASGTSRRS